MLYDDDENTEILVNLTNLFEIDDLVKKLEKPFLSENKRDAYLHMQKCRFLLKIIQAEIQDVVEEIDREMQLLELAEAGSNSKEPALQKLSDDALHEILSQDFHNIYLPAQDAVKSYSEACGVREFKRRPQLELAISKSNR